MPWVKGQSGNPGGRPKKPFAFITVIEEVLKEKGPDGIENRRAIVRKLVEVARDGNLEAIKILLERVDGKAVERKEISGIAGGPLEFTFSIFDGDSS